jgi:hypothetical protein
MAYGALERILRTERFRQRAAAGGGFSTPGLCFTSVGEDSLPLLATNMRGRFLRTRRNVEGLAPFGFSYCPVGEEGPLLNELHRTLWEISTQEGWSNRCTSIAGAVNYLHALDLEPKSLVVSESQIAGLLGPDFDLSAARRTMAVQGFVTVIDGMQLLLSDLPEGSALVAGAPSALGIYTRVGDYLGMLLQRINRVIVMVRPNVA